MSGSAPTRNNLFFPYSGVSYNHVVHPTRQPYMRAKEIVQRCATPERFKELCIKAQITHTYYLFHSLITKNYGKDSTHPMRERSTAYINSENLCLGVHRTVYYPPLIYCHYGKSPHA